jgi:hypothetical protein
MFNVICLEFLGPLFQDSCLEILRFYSENRSFPCFLTWWIVLCILMYFIVCSEEYYFVFTSCSTEWFVSIEFTFAIISDDFSIQKNCFLNQHHRFFGHYPLIFRFKSMFIIYQETGMIWMLPQINELAHQNYLGFQKFFI